MKGTMSWQSQLQEPLKLVVLTKSTEKKESRPLISFTVIDELGNGYACQIGRMIPSMNSSLRSLGLLAVVKCSVRLLGIGS